MRQVVRRDFAPLVERQQLEEIPALELHEAVARAEGVRRRWCQGEAQSSIACPSLFQTRYAEHEMIKRSRHMLFPLQICSRSSAWIEARCRPKPGLQRRGEWDRPDRALPHRTSAAAHLLIIRVVCLLGGVLTFRTRLEDTTR